VSGPYEGMSVRKDESLGKFENLTAVDIVSCTRGNSERPLRIDLWCCVRVCVDGLPDREQPVHVPMSVLA